MHTYRKNSEDKYEVGYYAPDYRFTTENQAVPVGTWETLSIHDNVHAAIMRVNFLNGGSSITGI